MLLTALRNSDLACPDLKRLDSLLARHRLTPIETGQVLLAALKVELSQVCTCVRTRACVYVDMRMSMMLRARMYGRVFVCTPGCVLRGICQLSVVIASFTWNEK